jgi:hypothetical protein
MAVSLTAANVDNIPIGKGKVFWKPEGADEYRLVGNVPEFEFTPTIERLDHFSSMEGVRTKDKSAVIEKSAQLRMLMEEWIPQNLALMLIGETAIDNGVATIQIMSEEAIRGAIYFLATNAVGPRWDFDLPVVEFTPTASINPISEEWGNMEVTGEVVSVASVFGEAEANFNVVTAPVNSVAPAITGTPTENEVLAVSDGTWTGTTAAMFTYQWFADGVAIAGANLKTLTLTASLVGVTAITAVVTAHNAEASVSQVSNSVGPVIAYV